MPAPAPLSAPLLSGLELRYARGLLQPILDGVSLTLTRGECVELVGPSGGGKSTLLLALARLLPQATHGALQLEGRDAAAIPAAEWRVRVALFPQRPTLVAATVGDELRLPWSLRVRRGSPAPKDDALRTALDALGLRDVELTRKTGELSVGQAARVALLRVRLPGPDVLLLDEPDAALDDGSVALVDAELARFVAAGGAVLRTRHRPGATAPTRRLRLASGTLSEVTA